MKDNIKNYNENTIHKLNRFMFNNDDIEIIDNKANHKQDAAYQNFKTPSKLDKEVEDILASIQDDVMASIKKTTYFSSKPTTQE